jgi:hypothetical protein
MPDRARHCCLWQNRSQPGALSRRCCKTARIPLYRLSGNACDCAWRALIRSRQSRPFPPVTKPAGSGFSCPVTAGARQRQSNERLRCYCGCSAASASVLLARRGVDVAIARCSSKATGVGRLWSAELRLGSCDLSREDIDLFCGLRTFKRCQFTLIHVRSGKPWW